MKTSVRVLALFAAGLMLLSTMGCAKLRARDQLNKGVLAYKNAKYEEAINHFQQAVKLDPKNATIVNNLGFTLYKLGKFWESITWFQKAIAIDHQRAIAYLNLADAYVRVGKPKEAKQNYEKFLELAPGSANAGEVRQRIVELQDK